MKMPAFQFYPADWRKDPGVQSLGFHDRGVWFELLCIMHESPERGVLLLNGTPMPEDAIARMLGLDKQILTTTLTTLLTYGVASRRAEDGAIFSRRMVKDEMLRKVRAESGKQGGNPVLLKQKPTTWVKQIPTPSSSSSSSSSDISCTTQLALEQILKVYPPDGQRVGVHDGAAAAALDDISVSEHGLVIIAAKNYADEILAENTPAQYVRQLANFLRPTEGAPRGFWRNYVHGKPLGETKAREELFDAARDKRNTCLPGFVSDAAEREFRSRNISWSKFQEIILTGRDPFMENGT